MGPLWWRAPGYRLPGGAGCVSPKRGLSPGSRRAQGVASSGAGSQRTPCGELRARPAEPSNSGQGRVATSRKVSFRYRGRTEVAWRPPLAGELGPVDQPASRRGRGSWGRGPATSPPTAPGRNSGGSHVCIFIHFSNICQKSKKNRKKPAMALKNRRNR